MAQLETRQSNLATLNFTEEIFNTSNRCWELPAAGSQQWIKPSNATIDDYTENVVVTPRDILSSKRRQQQGQITGKTVTNSFRNNTTLESVYNVAPALFFMNGRRSNTFKIKGTAITASSQTITIDALSADQAAAIPNNALVQVVNSSITTKQSGTGRPQNEKLHAVDASTALAAGGTTLTLQTATADLEDETGSNLRLSVSGRRFTQAEVSNVTVAGRRMVITFAAAHGLGAMGVDVGTDIHIGSPDFLSPPRKNRPVDRNNVQSSEVASVKGKDGNVYVNALETTNADDTYGWGTVTQVTSTTITIDDIDLELQGNGTKTIGTNLDLIFGVMFFDIDAEQSDFTDHRYHFELGTRGNAPGATYDYEYISNAVNTGYSFTYPDGGLSNITQVYAGTNKTNTDSTGRLADVVNAEQEIWRQGIAPVNNTSRLEIRNLAGSELTTGFQNLTMAIANNRSPIRTVDSLEARDFSIGNFNFTLQGTIYFTSQDVLNAIERKESTNYYTRAVNSDGVMTHRIPEMQIQSSPRQFTPGQPITQPINCTALDSFEYNAAGILNLIAVPWNNLV